HAVSKLHPDVLLFEARKFRDDLHFLIRLVELDAGPTRSRRAEWADVETAKRVVEQTIHLAVQRQKRAARVVISSHGQVARAVVPRNEITKCHWIFSFHQLE